jgi:hypothetical protein
VRGALVQWLPALELEGLLHVGRHHLEQLCAPPVGHLRTERLQSGQRVLALRLLLFLAHGLPHRGLERHECLHHVHRAAVDRLVGTHHGLEIARELAPQHHHRVAYGAPAAAAAAAAAAGAHAALEAACKLVLHL